MSATLRRRIHFLDGMRGIAILAVLAVHWLAPYCPWFRGGYVGVDVFFVVSGYVITRKLVGSRPSYRDFALARAQRLYPPLVAMLAFTVLLCTVAPGSPISPEDAVPRALVAVTQLSSPLVALNWPMHPFDVTWSLAVEWYFYLLWPLCLGFMLNRRMSMKAIATTCTVGALTLYAVALPLSARWFYFGPVERCGEILIGAAIAMRPELRVPPAALAAFWAMFAVWVTVGADELQPSYRLIVAPVVTIGSAATICHCSGVASSWITRCLSFAPLRAVGLVSYSLYLWHTVPLLLIDKDSMRLSLPLLGGLGVGFAFTATLASWWFLERPNSRRSVHRLATSPVDVGQ
jgi:peptidoglycan/LPS O-acetylase OafA/YrhL